MQDTSIMDPDMPTFTKGVEGTCGLIAVCSGIRRSKKSIIVTGEGCRDIDYSWVEKLYLKFFEDFNSECFSSQCHQKYKRIIQLWICTDFSSFSLHSSHLNLKRKNYTEYYTTHCLYLSLSPILLSHPTVPNWPTDKSLPATSGALQILMTRNGTLHSAQLDNNWSGLCWWQKSSTIHVVTFINRFVTITINTNHIKVTSLHHIIFIILSSF